MKIWIRIAYYVAVLGFVTFLIYNAGPIESTFDFVVMSIGGLLFGAGIPIVLSNEIKIIEEKYRDRKFLDQNEGKMIKVNGRRFASLEDFEAYNRSRQNHPSNRII